MGPVSRFAATQTVAMKMDSVLSRELCEDKWVVSVECPKARVHGHGYNNSLYDNKQKHRQIIVERPVNGLLDKQVRIDGYSHAKIYRWIDKEAND